MHIELAWTPPNPIQLKLDEGKLELKLSQIS